MISKKDIQSESYSMFGEGLSDEQVKRVKEIYKKNCEEGNVTFGRGIKDAILDMIDEL